MKNINDKQKQFSVLDDPLFIRLITYVRKQKPLIPTVSKYEQIINDLRKTKYKSSNRREWDNFFAYFYQLFNFNKKDGAKFCLDFINKGEKYVFKKYNTIIIKSIETYNNRNFYDFKYTNDKTKKFKHNKTNPSSNDILDIAEAIIDYSSPRSALKRIINNLRK